VFSVQAAGNAGMLRLDLRTTWVNDPRARDTVRLPDVGQPPTGVSLDGRYTDAELSAAPPLGRASGVLTMGLRFGAADLATAGAGEVRTAAPDRWAFGVLTMPLSGRLALQLGAGVQPALPDRAQFGGRFARFGFVWQVNGSSSAGAPPPAPAPPPSALHAIAEGPASFRVRIALPAASRVEIKGGFTDWKPVALQRAEDGVWETVLPAAPGVYAVNIRIDDGNWIVPPGLPAVPDEFGGMAGLLSL
jgi:hypothetical protein